MTKPLSEMLEAMEPKDGRIETMFMSKEVVAHWVDRASYDKLKAVAIELAKALETLSVAVNDKVEDNGATNFCLRAITRAKDIIGDSNG